MAVLADRVRAGQIRKAVIADVDPARASQFVDWMREDIADAPVIVIDNVAEYALGPGSPRHGWDVSDFPNAAPPWPIAWFEYRIPPNAMPVEDGPDQLGFWVAAEDTDDGWNLHCSGYGWYGREIRGPIAAYRVGVAPDGSVREFGPYPLKNAAPESALSTLPYLVPVLLAISFAHCKNVSERVISPPEKLSRSFRRKHGVPLTRYRVLAIDPMREVLRSEGGSDDVGVRRALHICRGHFKTFEERPLFGRVRGTYWWPAHVRGKADMGEVRKDYRVRLGRDGDTIQATSERTVSPGIGGYASPEQARAIEDYSVAKAVAYLQRQYPNEAVEVQPHSNPGFDIRVGTAADPLRYVEVKGTGRDVPEFFLSEGERQFSIDHAERYTLILVGDIDITRDYFDLHVHDGSVEESFTLRPVQWRASAGSNSP